MKRILNELQFINKEKSKELEQTLIGAEKSKDGSNEFHAVYTKVLQEMEKLSSHGKQLVLIIDSLNKVKIAEKTAKHLFWLPEGYPSGVSVIVSTATGDKATYDLLVTEQNYNATEIHPLSLEAQKLMCEEWLMKSGKEFSPPQLQRVVDADQTKNPLFLKIVLGEVSIYGYFFQLNEKIDSLIYSDGIRDLLSKVLKRLEDDYNVKEHSGSLVQQVLSALAISHRGLTEKEIQEMFNIASHVWSPFYFALENYLISHGGFLRFSFTEMFDAVKERYLGDEEDRNRSIRTVVRYFTGILQNLETENVLKDSTLKRIAAELPWLQRKLRDKNGLSQTISDIRIFYPLISQSSSEMIDLWKESGLGADEFCGNLLKSFNDVLADLYLRQQELEVSNAEPPGYILLPLLKDCKNFFSDICHHESCILISQRKISILEGIKNLNVREDVRITLLREENNFLASSFVDNFQYKLGEDLLRSVKKECESYLETNSNDVRAQQTLAYCCNGIGVLYTHQSRHKMAGEFFQQSADIHQTLGNDLCMAEALQNLGQVKMHEEQFESSLDYCNRSMEIYEREYFGHMPMTVGNLIHNMAIVQRRMGNNDEAERLYLRSMEVKAQAVGWDHEVIATTYMNLGALEMHRKNYEKAEEYTVKAINIHEGNNVKLEHNALWQPLENLANIKLLQDKKDEALPIFLRVFAMLKKEQKVYQGFTILHQQMMNYLVAQGKFLALIGVLEAYIASPELREPQYVSLMDHCYKSLPDKEKQTMTRPEEHTVEYALREIWPGNNALTGYLITNYVLPEDDIDRLIELLDSMDKNNPEFLSSTYSVGIIWCEGVQNWQAVVRVAKVGLEKYPEALELKTKLFDGLRKLQLYEEAYPMINDVLAAQEDNQALILIAGQVALMANDMDLCKELWEKVSGMPDEGLAQRAKDSLAKLADVLKQNENDHSI